MFPGRDISKLPLQEFLEGIGRYEASIPANPGERKIGGLTRTPNGSFKDEDLMNILAAAIKDPAGT